MTLIDLSANGYRRNGGIGFALESPKATLSFVKNPSIDLEILLHRGFSRDEITKLSSAISVELVKKNGLGVRLVGADLPRHHSGLGTGTALSLACVEAFSLLNNFDMTQREIILLSGRGGASGIGINAYFSGGFIFDMGRPFDDNALTSSDNMRSDFQLPTIFGRWNFPEWKIGIMRFPPGYEPSLETENSLFADLLPLSSEAVSETTYHAIFGVSAAIADGDFESFCRATNNIQLCSWKAAEINLYGDIVKKCMDRLRKIGCDCVGMSSVGPSLYFLAKNFDSVYENVVSDFRDMDVFFTRPSNDGRLITYD